MFPDLSWSHMLLVLIVALVVVGPKDLPKLMRKIGQWTSKARGMADQFRRSFDEMARQSELDELRKELDELRNQRPLAGIDQAMSKALNDPIVSLDDKPAAPADAAAPVPAPEPAAVEGQVLAPVAAEPVIDHSEPAPQAMAPAEPLKQGDLHPPAP
ncbi:sec-independent protein translocase protein TatB [Rhizomicrobium palustre]|uniref:Sec-independent protein translocase protein TatB n=1 Tax=Rhizomicrobium palustre TaxID=189966 RepID=A0A846MU62_9PROT|nr:Sec-independent protein translocase protein TatB [Rhizomicrobium palustre]NIK86974.1 sec-independent protein translocase protein TatB [Rhizomicrobium palustre]